MCASAARRRRAPSPAASVNRGDRSAPWRGRERVGAAVDPPFRPMPGKLAQTLPRSGLSPPCRRRRRASRLVASDRRAASPLHRRREAATTVSCRSCASKYTRRCPPMRAAGRHRLRHDDVAHGGPLPDLRVLDIFGRGVEAGEGRGIVGEFDDHLAGAAVPFHRFELAAANESSPRFPGRSPGSAPRRRSHRHCRARRYERSSIPSPCSCSPQADRQGRFDLADDRHRCCPRVGGRGDRPTGHQIVGTGGDRRAGHHDPLLVPRSMCPTA